MACHHHLCHCCSAAYTPCHHHHHHPPPDPYLHHPPHQPHLYSSNLPHRHEHYFQEGLQTHHAFSSLLRRIAALESILLRRYSDTSSSQSLRATAARIIQTHYRKYKLASIRSSLDALKSSVSEKTQIDYRVIYRKALNLRLKLVTIEGDDPIIYEKSSICSELDEFIDFIIEHYEARIAHSRIRNLSSNLKTMGHVEYEFEDLNSDHNVENLRGLKRN